jgi:hypothetical protein
MEEIRGTDCNELIKKVLEVEELRPVDLAKKIGVSRQYEPDYFQKQMRYSL